MTEQVFIVFENEFFEGDFVNRRALGVFSSEENAQTHIAFESSDVIYDPMLRKSYQVVPAILDEPIYMDEED